MEQLHLPNIALSKGSGSPKYALYEQWLRAAGAVGSVIDLWALPADEHSAALATCDGILFTGGPDVEPSRYGRGGRLGECFVDLERDAVEFALFEQAQERRMPVLGICRGLQLINVALGGSLVVDIPSDISTGIEHRSVNHVESNHLVEVEAGSLIAKLCRAAAGDVNSSHHQAAEHLPEQLRRAAAAPDGIIEAFEWSEPAGKGFLLGVQWHPERMSADSPFSLPIARHFLFEAEAYALLGAKRR
jgi:putative glutamine amidotransferase